MAKDASFEKITSIRPHPDADKLEIADINGWQVVVGKGEFKAGDIVFYIRDDAKLCGYDDVKAGNLPRLAWQAPLINYLGGGGRVKTIQLRGEWSSGIAVSLDKLFAHINKPEAKDWKKDNVVLNSEFPGGLLKGKYGVMHWEAPVTGVGVLKANGALPYGIPKSDEENFENLDERTLPFGEKVLLTKKLDGTSTTIIAFPDGRTHVCTRSQDLDKSCDNVWNRAATEVIPLAQAWAKANNQPIALRGETCAKNIQKFSFNKDKDVEVPTFYLYGVILLEEKDIHRKFGVYGTDTHFLKIAEQIKALTGKEIHTVPILGEEVLTKALLNAYKQKPLEFGEGIVINAPAVDRTIESEREGSMYIRTIHCPTHFKCKSLAYLAALSKKA